MKNTDNFNNNQFVRKLAFIFMLLFLLALLNRTGSLIFLWKEEPLGSVTHDAGHGYYAFVSDENISKLKLPFYLKEDGIILRNKPLSVNEDITASIKDQGLGAHKIMENNDLYFSASDNHPEAHEYSIISPVIIRNRYLLVLFALAALSTVMILVQFLKTRDKSIFKELIRWGSVMLLLLLLLPWDKIIISGEPAAIGSFLLKPLLQRNMIFICLLFFILLLDTLFREKNRFLAVLSVIIVLLNTVYYFIPEWNYFGRRADTADYLEHYTASSIRTPGYPVFIETVCNLTGNEGLEELRQTHDTQPDESLLDSTISESKGLVNIARAQKIVLAAAFLILFFVYSRYYNHCWFVLVAQIIFCGGFLGVDNSYIMTECLSQAVCLLTAALLILYMKEKKPLFFLVLCVIAGYGILVRPANIFLIIPIGICFLNMIHEKRNLLIPIIGCLAFLGISAIPAINIFSHYKQFVWMPTSGYVDIARAVELMQPGDEETFDDQELRDFCADLLVKKTAIGNADQNTYMWEVGIATAREHGYDLISCSPILGKVSRQIFRIHFREFISALAETMKTALERTRLQLGPIPFTALACLFIVLFVIKINIDSTTGMIIALMHMAHLFIFIVNQPERRYIYSTEILCLIGWLLIFESLFKAGNRR